MSRRILALVLLLSLPAVAEARPDTRRMTCGQVQATVARAGGIVLSTGEYTYDRYVRDARSCLIGQWVRRSLVPARDTPTCPLLTCYDPSGRWIWDD